MTAGLLPDASAEQTLAGRAISEMSSGRSLNAVVINSGEKKAIPHRPTIPATPKQTPTSKCLRQRGWANRSPSDPTDFAPWPAADWAFAFFQASGSLRIITIGTAIRAGNTLTKDRTCQP